MLRLIYGVGALIWIVPSAFFYSIGFGGIDMVFQFSGGAIFVVAVGLCVYFFPDRVAFWKTLAGTFLMACSITILLHLIPVTWRGIEETFWNTFIVNRKAEFLTEVFGISVVFFVLLLVSYLLARLAIYGQLASATGGKTG